MLVGVEKQPRQRQVRETVEFSVKGPVSVNFDEELLAPGCSVLDIIFTAPSSVRELVFRNYYTAWLTLLVRVAASKEQPNNSKTCEQDSSWTLGISHRKLMPVPQLEDGSQDLISILATESHVEWQNLSAIRLVLRQPSATWKTFHVEELNVFNDLPRRFPPQVNPVDQDGAHQAQKLSSLLNIIREQTKASLNHYLKKTEGQESPATPKENAMLGYEFSNLPAI